MALACCVPIKDTTPIMRPVIFGSATLTAEHDRLAFKYKSNSLLENYPILPHISSNLKTFLKGKYDADG